MKLIVNQKLNSGDWRRQLYTGSFFLWTNIKSAHVLGDWAEECINKFFNSDSWRGDYLEWSKDMFIDRVQGLKSHFTNSEKTKDLVRDFVAEIGEEPGDYCFDLPRLRVIPKSDYLDTGVSYNYKAHRDTWYGAPACQINTWMPVFDVQPESTMAMFPSYFNTPVRNSSENFDVRHWNTVERPAAVTQRGIDTRRHPLPEQSVSPGNAFLFAGTRGDLLAFSGDHLHSSQPHDRSEIRFSTDFRLYYLPDLKTGVGAPMTDDRSTSKDYYLTDLYRVADGCKLVPEENS